MSKFIESLKKFSNDSVYTENGMHGYASSGKVLSDFIFKVSSFRHMDESYICSEFNKLLTDPECGKYAMRALLYVRDIREGLGERKSFRIIISNLAEDGCFIQDKATLFKLFDNIAEVGRFDDILEFVDTEYEEYAVEYLKDKLAEDVASAASGQKISLLAKWLPSENASSSKTRALARKLMSGFGMKPAEYRKTLTKLRNHLNVVECDMCSKQWEKIDYAAVPSKANIRYANAFMRNDEERRTEYLEKLSKGETKINAAANFPSDILRMYSKDSYHATKNAVTEELWKAQKEVPGLEDTIVVCDRSGSMECPVSGNNSGITAAEVAMALAIYCGERCKAEYKNKAILFSQNPVYVDFSGSTLIEKYRKLYSAKENPRNTNIEKVFSMILGVAISDKLQDSDLPKQILIVSDMEFDEGVSFSTSNVFEHAKAEFEAAGYTFPRLIFWNVASRSLAVPMHENEDNVLLISGFSVNVIDLLKDPEGRRWVDIIIEKLMNSRYSGASNVLVEGASIGK